MKDRKVDRMMSAVCECTLPPVSMHSGRFVQVCQSQYFKRSKLLTFAYILALEAILGKERF